MRDANERLLLGGTTVTWCTYVGVVEVDHRRVVSASRWCMLRGGHAGIPLADHVGRVGRCA
eukprot:COSAG06_NODE_26645_length_610_cov_0.810176_1_plen_60_part_10